MHELSVCLALTRKVAAIAEEHGASRIERIRLRIGPLSGIETALLEHAFPLAAAGTPADGARLEIVSAPVVVACTVCGEETPCAPNRLLCGACGDFRTRIVTGDEMLLESLDLDLPDAGARSPAAETDAARA
jgi:hydrogenase nickel incorporation protein HypA/HybF